MPRIKKSRKPGSIGTPKSERSTSNQSKTPTDRNTKKKKAGKPSGSRNSQLLKQTEHRITSQKKDNRLGSKKPIALTTSDKKPRYFSPQEELAAIENDQKLDALLDKQEANKALSTSEQKYLDSKLARHQELCLMLGQNIDEDEQEKQGIESNEKDALLAKLEKGLDEFK